MVRHARRREIGFESLEQRSMLSATLLMEPFADPTLAICPVVEEPGIVVFDPFADSIGLCQWQVEMPEDMSGWYMDDFSDDGSDIDALFEEWMSLINEDDWLATADFWLSLEDWQWLEPDEAWFEYEDFGFPLDNFYDFDIATESFMATAIDTPDARAAAFADLNATAAAPRDLTAGLAFAMTMDSSGEASSSAGRPKRAAPLAVVRS